MSLTIKPKASNSPDGSSSVSDPSMPKVTNPDAQKSGNRPTGYLVVIPTLFGVWLVITSLAEVIPTLGVYDGKRILELCLIASTMLVLVFSPPIRQKLEIILLAIPTWIRVLLLIFFGLGLSSALLTPNPAYPLLDVAMLFLLVLTTVTLAIIRQLLGVYFDRVALACVALMGFGILVQESMGMLVYLSTDIQFNYRESLFHFSHPRLYNQVQTWTIPLLALLPLVFNKNRWMGLLSILLIGAQWYIILSTGARGTTVSLMLAMVIVGIALPTLRKFWLKIHITGLLLGILFYLSVVFFLGVAQPGKTDFVGESVGRPMLHTSGRTDLWQHAIEDAVQNPLLGAGPMRYACGADHYLAGSPHSFPFQIMGEWGFPAFLVLGILFGWLVYSWVQATKLVKQDEIDRQILVTCLSIACLAAMIHVCVSGLLIAPSSQVAGILVAGWLLGSLFNEDNQRLLATGNIGRYETLTLSLLGLMVSVLVLWFATTEIYKLPYRTSYAQDFGASTPRFWQDGRFCEYSF